MKLISGVIFFITAFALSSALSGLTVKRIATDQVLLANLMQNRGSNYAVPCFTLYTPIFDAILQEFSESYQLCGKTAQTEIDELNAEAAGNRTDMTATSEDMCNTMNACSDLADSLDFLNCYSSAGNANVKVMFNLASNASMLAATLTQEYTNVRMNMQKCQNASERAYAENSVNATDALNYCLVNGPPEVVTTTTAQTETTTEAIETTTLAEDTTTEAAAAESQQQVQVEELSASVKAAPKISPRLILRQPLVAH